MVFPVNHLQLLSVKNATELKKYENDKLLSESKKNKIINKLGDEVMTVIKDL